MVISPITYNGRGGGEEEEGEEEEEPNRMKRTENGKKERTDTDHPESVFSKASADSAIRSKSSLRLLV